MDRVAPALDPAHRPVYDRRLEEARDLLGTDEERGVLVEKAGPVLGHAPERSLIGDHAVRPRLSGATQLIERAAVDGPVLAPEAAARLARVCVAARRRDALVWGVDRNAEMRPASRPEPLPVADVRGKQDHRS